MLEFLFGGGHVFVVSVFCGGLSMWVRVFYLNLPLGCCGFDLVVLCCFLYLCVVVSCLVLFRVVLCWLFGLVWFGFEQGSMLWLSILWLAGENLCA